MEDTLIEVANIIQELRNTSGDNAKLDKLERYKENVHLETILKYTYDPFLKYGVSKTMMNKIASKAGQMDINVYSYTGFIDFLDELAKSNINDKLREKISSYYSSLQSAATKDLFKCILTKDLRIEMNAISINKVFPGLIPTFEVMRGKKYEDHKNKLYGKKIIITEKIDGVRMVGIVDEEGNVKFYSRQGKPMEGYVDIEAAVKALGVKNIVIDGEVVVEDYYTMNSKECYKSTMKIVGSDSPEKVGLVWRIYDCLPLSAFKEGVCKTKTSARKKYIDDKVEQLKKKEFEKGVQNLSVDHVYEDAHINSKFLKPLPILYYGAYDENVINEIHREIVKNGGEGVMINIDDAAYECKRTTNLLKVKVMHDCDLRIIGFEEGEVGSKFEGTLGAVVVDYKGYKLRVGSGFSQEERDYFWNNQDELLGRVISVQYFEETTNEDGDLSLRFPKFIELREIGKEVSYD